MLDAIMKETRLLFSIILYALFRTERFLFRFVEYDSNTPIQFCVIILRFFNG
jgi:hypothetical protein